MCDFMRWCGGSRSKNVNHDDRLGAQTVATRRRAPGINYPHLLQFLSDHFMYGAYAYGLGLTLLDSYYYLKRSHLSSFVRAFLPLSCSLLISSSPVSSLHFSFPFSFADLSSTSPTILTLSGCSSRFCQPDK